MTTIQVPAHQHFSELEQAECKLCNPPKKRECNRHNDCDAADKRAQELRGCNADHCHDECCEECFGY